ncbi:UxaA family hydrolase [Candidatus Bathyarchaeota archaeon]|jgi:altronate dehydratase small subunit|nr:UxaA family hydrolase [Candidatus Bathyarchaeota archaeon]MBT4320277.1 UxaA family hydrolase [Candidatus Bathyarchaeota archaeon]MBT4425021.1 UxaA family hydrolase [Candidatus Bathyarchaeota archaeon]MBT5642092.1 UxaA family hydrolase [Candidatus Bathyarchaeota archaeon]MBT6605689.1 UxaA family hydrolase [Candidatus Bathyarchaeota archaeon]
MSKKAIQIDAKDNVATATSIVEAGDEVEVLSPDGDVVLKAKPVEQIIFGHKIALTDLKVGDKIVKYGQVIGIASKEVKVGAWLHTHNVNSANMHTEGPEIRGVT